MAGVQAVVAVWNPLQDLIGAGLSDAWAAKHGGSRSSFIMPQFLLWPLICVAPFFPFMLKLMGTWWLCTTALCLDHSFAAFFFIAMGGLWTDITKGEAERIKINRLEKILSWLAIPMIGIQYKAWTSAQEANDVTQFVRFATMLALGGFAMCVVSMWQLSQLESKALKEAEERNQGDSLESQQEKNLSITDFIKGIPRHKNFWCFVVMNVINEMQSQFMGEFGAIFLDINLRGVLGTDSRAMYLTMEQVLVAAVGILITFVAQQYGCYSVYLYATLLKFVLGLPLVLFTPVGYVCAAYHMLVIVCNSATSMFFIIMVANLVDEYRNMQGWNASAASVTGLFWGTHALIAKPIDCLGPVLGTYMLQGAGWTGAAMKGTVTAEAQLAAWRLVIGFPVACGAIQLTAWYFYDLHGEKLQKIQGSGH
eukprot:gnl/MRDRNA2_/MRDRNA2_140021_c0_seq1.p1 gnl/MRDRNA2_/MRDRNA2_140021_c0~~gnl/MRDRNA2_/MRDRNA2_140021_c0_seq1.p1  ORF type:complete len:423 (+),score=83.72 gnl/MRDRNA2_/MRDRNA2_140021_c0_seq1:1-1269(+)